MSIKHRLLLIGGLFLYGFLIFKDLILGWILFTFICLLFSLPFLFLFFYLGKPVHTTFFTEQGRKRRRQNAEKFKYERRIRLEVQQAKQRKRKLALEDERKRQ